MHSYLHSVHLAFLALHHILESKISDSEKMWWHSFLINHIAIYRLLSLAINAWSKANADSIIHSMSKYALRSQSDLQSSARMIGKFNRRSLISLPPLPFPPKEH